MTKDISLQKQKQTTQKTEKVEKNKVLLTALFMVGGVILLILAANLNNIFPGGSETVQTLTPRIALAESGDSLYTAKEALFEADFAGNNNPSRVVFRKDGSSLSFDLPYENIDWKKEGEVLVADVGGGRAYSYELISSKGGSGIGLKEMIILKEPEALLSRNDIALNEAAEKNTDPAFPEQNIQNRFEFSINLENLSPKKDDNGLWRFYNSSGKELFYIPEPYMEDSEGAKSRDVIIDIITDNNNEQNKLVITADKEWLTSPDRVYPIYIDPTLQITVLTVHSSPQKGDHWIVEFETEGAADLRIIPDDRASINDMDFVELKCGEQTRNPQILEGDVIYYSNWECADTASVSHLIKKTGDHTLRFEFGDQIAYAYNSGTVSIKLSGNMKMRGFSFKFDWNCGDTISYEGQIYDTVLINDQCWMAESLNVGTRIDGIEDQGTSCDSIEKYCYDNDEANCTTYGALYQWDQAMCGAASSTTVPSGVQGICPDGWHIPSDAEWHALEYYLAEDKDICDPIRSGESYDCEPAGSRMAGEYNLWAWGDLRNHSDFGTSGLDVLPSGSSTSTGYSHLGHIPFFWSTTENESFPIYAIIRNLQNDNIGIRRHSGDKLRGYSIRCIKD